LEKLRVQWDGFSEKEQIILMAGFNLLDDVWKASHKQ
jgi:ATP-dependent Zn protease